MRTVEEASNAMALDGIIFEVIHETYEDWVCLKILLWVPFIWTIYSWSIRECDPFRLCTALFSFCMPLSYCLWLLLLQCCCLPTFFATCWFWGDLSLCCVFSPGGLCKGEEAQWLQSIHGCYSWSKSTQPPSQSCSCWSNSWVCWSFHMLFGIPVTVIWGLDVLYGVQVSCVIESYYQQ